MSKIQEWVYNLLVQIGLISENSSYLDNIVILLLIIAVTVGIDYSCRYIFLGMFKRLARKTKNQLDDLIVDRKIINKMMHMIPAILIYILLPFAFSAEETPKILILLQKLCQIYIIAVSLRFINASLNLIHEIYNKKDLNPAKRKAMAVKNEKRFLKQKRNALKNPGYSRHPVKTQASFKRLLKAV